jgi:hypothetical protein
MPVQDLEEYNRMNTAVLEDHEDESIWEQVTRGYADAEAAKDGAYLLEREAEAGFQRFDMSTPTTCDRVIASLEHCTDPYHRDLRCCSKRI